MDFAKAMQKRKIANREAAIESEVCDHNWNDEIPADMGWIEDAMAGVDFENGCWNDDGSVSVKLSVEFMRCVNMGCGDCPVEHSGYANFSLEISADGSYDLQLDEQTIDDGSDVDMDYV